MNEFNCNSLKNLPVPEKLIQKALAIPETAEKAPAVLPRYRRGRMTATAASIVLVTVLGISLYFLFGNIDPPVEPSVTPARESVSDTAAPDETAKNTAPPLTVKPSDGVSSATDGTQKPSQPAVPPSAQTATDSAGRIVSAPPTGAPEITPTEARRSAPTKQPGTAQKQEPTQKPSPTRRATENPVTPTSQPITHPPTEALLPTVEPAIVTEPEWEQPSPTEPAHEPQSAATQPPVDTVLTFRSTIRVRDPQYSGKVYCRIYDRNARAALGDPDRFADSHRAEYTLNGNAMTAVYRPSEHGISVPPGSYAVSFYDESGDIFIGWYETVR